MEGLAHGLTELEGVFSGGMKTKKNFTNKEDSYETIQSVR
jgi:hypothetical protein